MVEIKINSTLLKRVTNQKYLGVILDCHLRWNIHVQTLIYKTRYSIFIFYKLSRLMRTDTMLIIYQALFHSYISYGIVSWGGAKNNVIEPLQKLQNKLLKIIFKRSNPSIKPLNVKYLFIVTSLTFHYDGLKKDFEKLSTTTRNKNLSYQKIAKSHSKKMSKDVAIRNFNLLPFELRTLKCTKKLLKQKLAQWIRL